MNKIRRLRLLFDWLDDNDLHVGWSEEDTCVFLVDEDDDIVGICQDTDDLVSNGEDLRAQYEASVLLQNGGFEINCELREGEKWRPSRLVLQNENGEVVHEAVDAESWTTGFKDLCAQVYGARIMRGAVLGVEE